MTHPREELPDDVDEVVSTTRHNGGRRRRIHFRTCRYVERSERTTTISVDNLPVDAKVCEACKGERIATFDSDFSHYHALVDASADAIDDAIDDAGGRSA